MVIIKQIGGTNQVNINFNFVVNHVNNYSNYEKEATNGVKQDMSNGNEKEKEKKQNEQKADKNFSEIIEKFKEKKVENLRLEQAYVKMQILEKAERVRQCSTFLEFMVFGDGSRKLSKANFCRDRLCPECAWRRSLKLYSENRRCFENLGIAGRFVFLTVTCRNVAGDELKSEITKYLNGFKNMMRRKEIKTYVLGMIKALEVTYSKENGTFHPHIHCVMHMKESYFNRGFINQTKWRNMWVEAMDLDYVPNVFIKAFKVNEPQNMGRELAEVSKYCVKFNSFMDLPDKDFFKAIEVLSSALHGRRLITFSGSFRDARKQLKLKDDIQDKQELGVDGELDEDDEGYKVLYYWHFKEQRYKQKSWD